MIGISVSLLIGIIIFLAFKFDVFYISRLGATDFLFRLPEQYSENVKDDQIILVAIDDPSIEALGRFQSWPRTYHTQLIKNLSASGAKLIVFDILFSESSPDDAELTSTIKSSGNIILPVTGVNVSTEPYENNGIIEYQNILKPVPQLAEAAVAMGSANMIPDEDGVVRRLPAMISSGGEYEMALSIISVNEYRGKPQIVKLSQVDGSFSADNGARDSYNGFKAMLINYRGISGSWDTNAYYKVVSYADVLNGNYNADIFRDRLVIVGMTATGFGDIFWVPSGRMMNGVEIHANAIKTILNGEFLTVVPSWLTGFLIFLLSIVTGIIVLRFRILWALFSVIMLGFIYYSIAILFFENNLVLDLFYPPLSILCAYVGVNIFSFTYERSEKQKITNLFGRFVPKEVVNNLLLAIEDSELKLGGEEREITVAFADVRGFTNIASNLPPQELVSALNTYLSVIIDAVLKHGGMINKFDGDSIMAVWNVPTAQEGHALNAIKSALDAQRDIKVLREQNKALPIMDFGMGINTGKAVAGNMGSKQRLEYSVIGDTVNMASRLTSAAPEGKILIGSETYEYTKDYIDVIKMEPLYVKGKTKPLTVYEVIDFKSNVKR